jgi:hypothetical protein
MDVLGSVVLEKKSERDGEWPDPIRRRDGGHNAVDAPYEPSPRAPHPRIYASDVSALGAGRRYTRGTPSFALASSPCGLAGLFQFKS